MLSLNHSTSLSHISAPVRGRILKYGRGLLLSSFVFAGAVGGGAVFGVAHAQDVASYTAGEAQTPEKPAPTPYADPAAQQQDQGQPADENAPPAPTQDVSQGQPSSDNSAQNQAGDQQQAQAPADNVAPLPPAPMDASAAENSSGSIMAKDNAPPAPAVPEELKKKPQTDDEPPKLKPSEAAKTQGNPYGLGALWKNGDMVARSVLMIMLIMSIGSWIIIVMKFIEQQRLFFTAREVGTDFWNSDSVKDAAEGLTEASPFRYIADSALVSAEGHAGKLRDAIDLQSWISMSISRAVDAISSRLQGGLAFLGTVGSTSPFVGLFGTVWGIYHALTAIGTSGQASLDKVAGPVGESLIMTAIGLATAVPAVLGYNLLVRRNKAAMERINDFAADILSVLIGGKPHDSALNEIAALEKENQKPITRGSDVIVDDGQV
ncbi:MotA/TolQ/ExbB proton channel family protein [Acetobacteraceae bacterium]|nr:MotA/TolQ/ExbB proton channel family protein [Acetobacteraceae bacterium]